MKVSFYVIPEYSVIDEDTLEDVYMCKLVKIEQYWIFKFKSVISMGTEQEMKTLAQNLTKIYGQ